MPRTFTYSRSGDAYTAARTMLQVANATTKVLEIRRCWASVDGVTTSTDQFRFGVGTRTGAATGLTAAVNADIKAHNPSQGNSAVQLGTALTGYGTALTAEGTGDSYIIASGYNNMNEFLYVPGEQEIWEIATSGIFVLRLLTTPSASRNFNYGVTWREWG